MHAVLEDIERAIARMTGCLRRAAPGDQAGFWQVVVVGEPLDPEDFASRDRVREELRLRVLSLGIRLAEHVWIWDETGRAQLVVATYAEHERALRLAQAIRGKGLSVRVVRARPEDSGAT